MLPGDAPQEAVTFWGDVIAKVVETEDWRAFLERNGSVPYYKPADEFRELLQTNERLYREIFTEFGLIK